MHEINEEDGAGFIRARTLSSHRRLALVGASVAAVLVASAIGTAPAFADTTADLSGSVLDAGAGVPGVDVVVYQYDDETGRWSFENDATTDASGAWSLPGASLSDGNYALWYEINYNDQEHAIYSVDQGWNGAATQSKLATEFTVTGTTVSQTNFTQTLARNAGAVSVVVKDADTGGVLNGKTDGTSSASVYFYSGYDASDKPLPSNSTTVAGADFTGTVLLGHLGAGTYYDVSVYSSQHNGEYLNPVSIGAGATTNVGDVLLYSNGHDSVNVSAPYDVTISGDPKVGTLLTANLPPTNGTPTFQWYSTTGPIPGATQQTFVPTANLIGAQLSVSAILRSPGFASTTVSTDAPTTAVKVGDPNQASVTISGKAKYHSTVKAAVAGATVADAKYSYQWYRNGAVIAGADGSSYVLGKADLGASLVVSVSSVSQGHTDAVIPSAALVVPKDSAKVKATASKKITTSKKLKVTVSLKAGSSKLKATGKVKVFYTSKKYKSVTFTSKSKSAKSVTLPKLKKGKHTIKIAYAGSSTYKAKTVSIKVKVTK